MNNRLAVKVAVVAILVLFAGISGFGLGSVKSGSTTASQGTGGLKVLATFLPVYEDAIDVLGTKGGVKLLVPFGVDVHRYEPTPSAVELVRTADVLVFNGAGLEPWIPAIVSAADNRELVLVNASQGLPLIRVPSNYQDYDRTVDPHVWNDPVLAQMQVDNIMRGFAQADPADSAYFAANADALNARFQFIDQELRTGTLNVATRTFVSFHESFGYVAERYGLVQVSIAGPFEEEPTPTDIAGAIAAIAQNHLCIVFAESLENPASVNVVAGQTRAHVWTLDPIEGLSQSDLNAGVTYIVKMQQNVDILLKALNQADC